MSTLYGLWKFEVVETDRSRNGITSILSIPREREIASCPLPVSFCSSRIIGNHQPNDEVQVNLGE